MRSLIQSIEAHTESLGRSLRTAGNANRRNSSSEDEINGLFENLRSAIDQLNTRFQDHQSSSADARTVLDSASRFNTFLTAHRANARVDEDWRLLQADLDELARAYYINDWRWDTDRSVSRGSGRWGDALLTGTYRLSSSLGDDPRRAAEDATRSLPQSERQRVYDALIRRLEPPDMLAIDRHGSSVTIASSKAPQIDFVADGSEHIETTPSGRSARVRATLSGGQLTIERTGERAQDFSVTFEPTANGRQLLVTRRIDSDQLNQPLSIRSYYEKTSDVAQLNLYKGTGDYGNVGAGSRDFVVPDGTEVVAVLDTNISTRTARNNDRFTMTVRSPEQYSGATIEGYVTNVSRSGRISGRSEMTLNFENIRLRNGETHRFAGFLETVTGGEGVRVDNEGVVREEESQTNRTVKRAGIGTAVGAIIGAIAGGGKGAAIGAIVGAGAGAGSVYVQDKGDLELTNGTEMRIRATGPR